MGLNHKKTRRNSIIEAKRRRTSSIGEVPFVPYNLTILMSKVTGKEEIWWCYVYFLSKLFIWQAYIKSLVKTHTLIFSLLIQNKVNIIPVWYWTPHMPQGSVFMEVSSIFYGISNDKFLYFRDSTSNDLLFVIS